MISDYEILTQEMNCLDPNDINIIQYPHNKEALDQSLNIMREELHKNNGGYFTLEEQ